MLYIVNLGPPDIGGDSAKILVKISMNFNMNTLYMFIYIYNYSIYQLTWDCYFIPDMGMLHS
jgi:hypothetical protein